MIENGKLTADTRRAMRATTQWLLGDRGWGTMLADIAEAKDPIGFVEDAFLDGETVRGLLSAREDSRW